MASYATVEDYELRTGLDVPTDQEPTVQQRLDDVSTLIELYLGPCAADVEAAYPDVLTTITCLTAQRSFMAPQGVRSESVGSTSVAYQDPTEAVLGWLRPSETDVLDALIRAACPTAVSTPGVGELGVGWAGPPNERTWASDVDIWVVGRPS